MYSPVIRLDSLDPGTEFRLNEDSIVYQVVSHDGAYGGVMVADPRTSELQEFTAHCEVRLSEGPSRFPSRWQRFLRFIGLKEEP